MLIVDAHLDLSWNALQWNRDLTLSVQTIRTQESTTPGKGRAQNTVALPELRQGKIALCFATLLARSTGRLRPHTDFYSQTQAYGTTQGQLAYYRALEMQGQVRIIENRHTLDQHMAEWTQWDDAGADPEQVPPLGFVISMESADSILAPEQLVEWKAAGLRLLGPAHQGRGRYVGGTGVEDGFTGAGLELLKQMEQQSIILDLTHLPDKAFWQALDHFHGPVIASHNNCRALVPHQRQFSDEQINAIIARAGVIGMALSVWMLQPGWIHGDTNANVSLERVVDHVDHICQLAGNCNHVGIGSDLDGGFGKEESPHDLDTIADLQQMIGLLENRGYRHQEISRIMHGNWLRVLHGAWQN